MTSAAAAHALFWCACIPIRVLIAGAVYVLLGYRHIAVRALVATALAAPAIGWIVIAARQGLELGDSADHRGFFGGPVWWSVNRVVHAALFLGASVVAASGFPEEAALLCLLADATVGAVTGLLHGR